MNPSSIYQGIVNRKEYAKDDALAQARLEGETLEAWKNWRTLPQTQEFLRILTDQKNEILIRVMRNSTSINVPNPSLIEANTLDKILNSVAINGKYETPI